MTDSTSMFGPRFPLADDDSELRESDEEHFGVGLRDLLSDDFSPRRPLPHRPITTRRPTLRFSRHDTSAEESPPAAAAAAAAVEALEPRALTEPYKYVVPNCYLTQVTEADFHAMFRAITPAYLVAFLSKDLQEHQPSTQYELDTDTARYVVMTSNRKHMDRKTVDNRLLNKNDAGAKVFFSTFNFCRTHYLLSKQEFPFLWSVPPSFLTVSSQVVTPYSSGSQEVDILNNDGYFLRTLLGKSSTDRGGIPERWYDAFVLTEWSDTLFEKQIKPGCRIVLPFQVSMTNGDSFIQQWIVCYVQFFSTSFLVVETSFYDSPRVQFVVPIDDLLTPKSLMVPSEENKHDNAREASGNEFTVYAFYILTGSDNERYLAFCIPENVQDGSAQTTRFMLIEKMFSTPTVKDEEWNKRRTHVSESLPTFWRSVSYFPAIQYLQYLHSVQRTVQTNDPDSPTADLLQFSVQNLYKIHHDDDDDDEQAVKMIVELAKTYFYSNLPKDKSAEVTRMLTTLWERLFNDDGDDLKRYETFFYTCLIHMILGFLTPSYEDCTFISHRDFYACKNESDYETRITQFATKWTKYLLLEENKAKFVSALVVNQKRTELKNKMRFQSVTVFENVLRKHLCFQYNSLTGQRFCLPAFQENALGNTTTYKHGGLVDFLKLADEDTMKTFPNATTPSSALATTAPDVARIQENLKSNLRVNPYGYTKNVDAFPFIPGFRETEATRDKSQPRNAQTM